MQQTIDSKPVQYTLDINTGLPNVLSDATSTYTFGLGNLSRTSGTQTDCFLGVALGSTRQLTGDSRQIGLAESYDPFGDPISSAGAGSSIFGYTGQQTEQRLALPSG